MPVGSGLGALADAGRHLVLYGNTWGKRAKKRLHIGETVLGFYRQRFQEGGFHLGRDPDPQLRRPSQRIPVDALHRVRRELAGNAPVHCRPHGVHVRPGTLVAVAGILFLRCVSPLQDNRHALAVPQCEPGRAEIQQAAFPLGGDVNVVRADVPMQQVEGVHLDQRLHNGLQDGDGLVPGDSLPVFGKIGFQAHAVDVLHYKVGGAVFLEIVLHRHDVGSVLQLGQDLGLLQETLHAVLVIRFHPAGKGHAVMVRVPRGQGRGHVFLDSHLDLQGQVVPQIGDAKPAHAQHLPHQVPSVQDGPQRQGQVGLLVVLTKPAAGAWEPRFFFRKTPVTNTLRIHTPTSLISAATKRSPDTCRTRWTCRRRSAFSHASPLAAFKNSICTSRGST